MSRAMPPLLWQGALFDPSGYSEDCRCVLYACHEQAAEIAARDWQAWTTTVELTATQRAIVDHAAGVRLPAPPYVDVFHKTIPPASRATLHRERGPTVLRTMFETDSLPGGWAEQVARFDRVWVPSEFNVRTFAGAGVPREKLRVFAPTLDFAALRGRTTPLALPAAAWGMRFLSVFDFSERKGWRTLIDAWADSFEPADDVSLVIKSSGFVMGVDDAGERIDAYVGERRTAPIVVIDRSLSSAEMAGLYRAVDAFVLPSRGEGWGRPLMEAMAVGLPTIGPRWGGSLSFMSDENSFLVDGDVVAVAPGPLVFDRYLGQRWFEPDRDELVRALRAVAAGGTDAAERAARAGREIPERFGSRPTVDRLEELAVEALAGYPEPASDPGEATGRAR
jgi:glycosyltransferase involved in cell wall biosynthesis